MIVRIHPAGRSFKWLAAYLGHDADKAKTSERVSFVHTLNLAHDDAKSAVDSMLHTYRARHLLKASAGIRPGARDVEKPVHHISLSWNETERPTREQMIADATSYLKAIGAEEREAVIWGHTDKKHPHVHLMVNLIHPERGTCLDRRYERRKTQRWAAAYEKERGEVFCSERLKPVAERRPSPPRNVWMELRELRPEPAGYRKEAAAIDYDVPPHLWRRQEWIVLKDRQKEERVSFFEDLVGYYRVYRQHVYNTTGVHFRKEWDTYFKLKRAGTSAETLKALKDDIVARQKARYQQAVREASPKMQEERDRAHKALLANQKEERAQLVDRQEVGLASPQLISRSISPAAKPSFPLVPGAASPENPGLPHPFVWTAKAGMGGAAAHCGSMA